MKKAVVVLAALFVSTMLLPGCGAQEARRLTDKVSVRLKWLHQAQFAGLYAADQNGFYAQENIEVTLNPGGIEVDEVERVASGADDFGIASPLEIIKGRADGLPVRAIAVIFQRNAAVQFALKDSGIERPQDFVGHKVLIRPGTEGEIQYRAVMKRAGVDTASVEEVFAGYDMTPLFEGQVDVWIGYLTDQVIVARQKGYEVNIIYPDDYGVHLYGDTILTTDKMIEERPDLVERFLRATLRGWRYAIENPASAVDMTLKYDESLKWSEEMAELEATIPLVYTGEHPVGWMEGGLWEGMQQLLLDQKVLDQPIVIDEVYTPEFLRKISGEGGS